MKKCSYAQILAFGDAIGKAARESGLCLACVANVLNVHLSVIERLIGDVEPEPEPEAKSEPAPVVKH